MSPHELTPLKVGDLALRFKIAHRAVCSRLDWSRPFVIGMEACQVITQEGDRVVWTNHKRNRTGERFTHTSPRAELIALAAIENLCTAPAENPAVPITASAE